MKKSFFVLVAIIAAAAVAFYYVTVINNPERQIVGKWMNSTGSSGYEFFDDSKVKMTYANFTIPILDIPFEGDVDGTYVLDKKAETITMTGTFFVKSVDITFNFKIDGKTLTLTNPDNGNAVTYIKQDDTVTTVK